MQEDIKNALEVLRKGGVILYPTDTIWGLGCDATNSDAVKRIFEIKKRKDNKSLIVLSDSIARISGYVSDIPDVAYDLFDLSDTPLTIILEGAKNLSDSIVNQQDKSVGIRIPNDDFCQKLIQRFKKPIVSTSANISDKEPPKNFSEIDNDIIEAVDYVVKYRQDEMLQLKPSSIIKLGADGKIKVIRE